MGGRKLRFYQRKKDKRPTSLSVSPAAAPALATAPASLPSLVSQLLPESWAIATNNPLTIVKLTVHNTHVTVSITLCIQSQLTWTISVFNISLDTSVNPSLCSFNSILENASDILSLLRVIDSLKICAGNPDSKFFDLWKHLSSTLHGSSSKFFLHNNYTKFSCDVLYR